MAKTEKKKKKNNKKNKINRKNIFKETALLPPRVLGQLAEEVAKTVVERLPQALSKRMNSKKKKIEKKKKLENAIFLDTSAIIDGRILDVAKLGFIWGTVVVPEFILLELKHIADNPIPLKRARGRAGLIILGNLKKVKGLRVKITNDNDESPEIDEKLIKIAKAYKGKIITCDFNLNRKATIEGIGILNVNELANALKAVVLPGEELRIKVVQEGKEKGQGVGYLLDGTMIVVEGGSASIGRTVDVAVSRIFQTAAGRMIFTKLKE